MKRAAESGAGAVIYLRVSTQEQAESGLGLEAQRARCLEYAERAVLEVRGIFTDSGVSGAAALDRCPALAAALAAVPTGGVLLVAKRDRLGRDNFRLAMIEREAERRRVRIVSAAGEGTDSDDPAALLMRRMVDAFGEYERLLIGVRTAAALAAKRARGERLGTTPLGWRTAPDGTVQPDPAGRAAVERARELRARGCTFRGIAAALTAEGHQTKRGGRWQANTVRLLCRPRYLEEVAA